MIRNGITATVPKEDSEGSGSISQALLHFGPVYTRIRFLGTSQDISEQESRCRYEEDSMCRHDEA